VSRPTSTHDSPSRTHGAVPGDPDLRRDLGLLDSVGIGFGAIVAFTTLKYFGIRRSSRANLAFVTVSVGALILFVIGGIGAFSVANLRPFAPGGWRGTMETAAVLFFAHTGYARIAKLAEEVRDPRPTMSRVIGVTIGGAVLLYFEVALVAVGAVGAEALAETAAPLQVSAQAFSLPAIAVSVSVAGVTATLGVILSRLLGLSRMGFAMVRRGYLPTFLSRVDPVAGVPRNAVLLIGAVAALVAETGTLAGVAMAASFAILICYGITNVCALRRPRRVKLYPDLIPMVGLVSCIVLALSLSADIILTGLAILLTGVVLRSGARWFGGHTQRSGRE